MRKALKLALEALEGCHTSDKPMHQFFNKPKTDKAITAIKEALAQDELCSSQEPVAEVKAKQDGYGGTFIQQYQLLEHGTTLYTAPPKAPWISLTAADRWKIIYATEQDERITVLQLVEAKLKEKNT